MTTVIVGGGASGLAGAIRLKQIDKNMNVIILERLQSVGKKILATGNGRCNITNKSAKHYNEVSDFFNSIGLYLREDDDGRIYPYSLKSETVLEILLKACNNLKIEIVTECNVTDIKKSKNTFTVNTDKGIFKADNVIIAAGGMAQKNLGSNGSGYDLVKKFGHSITPLSPALVQLTSSSKYPRAIKGTRTKCNIKIELDSEIVKEEYGEVLFTDYGLSGIATMNLSDIVGKNFSNKNPKKCVAVLDLIPEIEKEDLKSYIEQFGSLTGILGTKLSNIISKQANEDAERCAEFAKNWRLIITGTKGYDFAQITSGGVPLNEIDEFESLKVNNLYICGEILDLQYECGGFNLDSAWYCGIKAADRITGKEK